MEIILANDFTNDTYARRTVRLQEIQENIDTLQPELGVDPSLLSWGQNCHTNFMNKWTAADIEMGQKEGAFLGLAQLAQEMEFTYQDIKEVIISRYADAPQKLEEFKFEGRFPDGTKAQIEKIRKVYDNCELHRSLGYEEAIPVAMSDRLKNAADAVEEQYSDADRERFESEHATHDLNVLFDEDAKRLSELHAWAKAIWGRYDLRFELIGMVPAKQQSGGGGGEVPDAPINFEFNWLDPVLQFRWDPVESATSYQLAFSEDGGEVWEELYTGADTSCEYEPPAGLRQYRIRARNAGGYGEWSAVIEFEVEGEAPVGDWPNAPSEVGAELITDPSTFMRVYYTIPGGSDSVSIYRAVVPHGNAAPERPASPYTTDILEEQYADTDVEPGNDYYYWVCGVQGGEEGDFAGPAVGEV